MSAARVRAICEVANLWAIGPTSGSRSSQRSNRARWPGRRTHAANATAAAAIRPRISQKLPTTKSETATMPRVTSGSSRSKLE